MTINNKKYTAQEILQARHELWRQGNLSFKFSPTQKRMYEFWQSVNNKESGKTSVINAGRRVGKTYFLSVLALEQCIKHPKSTVKFLQPEKGQVKTNVLPVMDKILEDCPIDMRPEFKHQSSCYEFPNGSRIQLGGTDRGNHEKFRGDDAHLCLIDEAGFLQAPLGYIIRSILAPATMRTFGKIILSSSTPTDPTHEFVGYMESSKLRNTFFGVTTKQCLIEHEEVNDPRFTREMYEHLVEEYPLREADEEFRRECLNVLVVDGTNSVIPEFNSDLEEEIVTEWKRPPFCDKYVSMDIGFKDLTVVLFGYYDFRNAVTVIEDEIVINGPKMTTQILAEKIKEKEAELWVNPMTQELELPYMRICDNNLILINDLNRLHSLSFIATDKDNKEAQINNLRMDLANYKIYISPKCKTLIHHLKHATWDKHRKNYTRSPDSGHYDAVDALIYFIRNVQKHHNPYPHGYDFYSLGSAGDIFVRPSKKDIPKNHEPFRKIFNVKKRN